MNTLDSESTMLSEMLPAQQTAPSTLLYQIIHLSVAFFPGTNSASNQSEFEQSDEPVFRDKMTRYML